MCVGLAASPCVRFAIVGIVGLLLGGCGERARVMTAEDWVARGDAALASDPGRALADYRQARDASPSDTRSPGVSRAAAREALGGKVREAATRWLRADVARFRASADAADDRRVVGEVEVIRRHAREHGVADALEPELRALEAEPMARLLASRKAEIAKAATPLDALAAWQALALDLPADFEGHAREARAAAREVARLREARVAHFETLAREAGGRPGTTLVRGRLLAMARALPRAAEKTEPPAGLARRLVVAWEGSGGACPGGVTDAFRELRSAGARPGRMRLDVTCEVGAPRASVETQRSTKTVARTVSTSGSERVCTQRPTGAYRNCVVTGLNGRCISGEAIMEDVCTNVPVRGSQKVEQDVEVTTTVKVNRREVRVAGKLLVEVDGRTTEVPVEAKATATNSSTGDAEPSPPSPEFTVSTVMRGPVAELVRKAARTAEDEVVTAHLARIEAELASGDLDGAEEDLGVAVATGRGRVAKGFAALAARDGVPFDAWVDVVLHEVSPLKPIVGRPFGPTSYAGLGLGVPQADAEGLVIAEQARARDRVARTAAGERYEEDAPRTTWALGLTHWDTYGGTAGLGPLAGLALRGAGGSGLAFYAYDGSGALEAAVGGGLGGGFDVLGRLGGGLRTRPFSVALHGALGASGRGTPDASLYVPMGLDVGVGARVAVRTSASSRLELLGERLSRPLRGAGDLPPPILQRFRYELRLVHRTDAEEMGVGASCSFHQLSASDLLVPAEGIRGRSCDLAIFLPL